MAKNKGEKPKLNTATFIIKNGALYEAYAHGEKFIFKITSRKEALDYVQQLNYDITYLEE